VRILHWYPNYFAGGAIASAVCGLATAQSLLGSDTAIAAVTVTGSPLYKSMENRTYVTIIRWTTTWTLQCKQLRLRGIPKEAVHRLHDFNPDLIHIHGEFNPDNLWVPCLFRRPIVVSPPGVFFPEAMEKYSIRPESRWCLLEWVGFGARVHPPSYRPLDLWSCARHGNCASPRSTAHESSSTHDGSRGKYD
jgi:hypothetical protein